MKPYLAVIIGIIFSGSVVLADETQSNISSVKVYQNQALIERTAEVHLKKGENSVVLTGLPKSIYDWSIKSSLPKGYDGKILTVQVEQKMLVERFQKKVGEIEDKLKNLRQKDQDYVDELASLKTQERFVDSVLNFTQDNASKELQTRIPQIKVWDDTLGYCAEKKRVIADKRRKIENAREDLGKEIQKWEFELSQIAGTSYFSNYQMLSKARSKNISAIAVQEYGDSNAYYAANKMMLTNPSAGTDIEKRIVLSVFSASEKDAKISFSYLIPNTVWNMVYDVRASRDSGKLELSVYGDIYQKTGEDWDNVSLFLSTGSPSNAVSSPYFSPWYLSIYQPRSYGGSGYASGAPMKKAEEIDEIQQMKDEPVPVQSETIVSEKGAFVEMALPLKQTIPSTDRTQKKFIKEYTFTPGKELDFNYEIYTWQKRESFITAQLTNTTDIPWLAGEAQVFLENEYMGKISLPYMPSGKKETVTLGNESRVRADKILVKKYEDSTGVFGGKRRIVYSYQITVENNLKTETKVIVRDRLPVSQNEKIEVEIKNLSHPFLPEEGKDDMNYKQGQRKILLNLKSGDKVSIKYEVAISFDKDASVSGLK